MNELSPALSIYTIMPVNTHKYDQGEMRNKKLVNRKKRYHTRMAVLQSIISPWKRKRKKRKKSYYNTGYSNLVTHPSTNPVKQGLTLLSFNFNVTFGLKPQVGGIKIVTV